MDLVNDLVRVRKKTPNLIDQLRKEAPHIPEGIAKRLHWCLDQIELGMDRRHMAVHGAWSASDKPDTYRVDYFLNTGTDKEPRWVAFFKTDFTFEELTGVVRDAEAILLEAVEINNALIRLEN